jgi:adenylosuccinate synthase
MAYMNTKEAYKEKMKAELELARAQLEQLEAQSKISSADAAMKFSKEIDDLEKNVGEVKVKLKELDDADDTTWENFKEGADNAWNALKTSVGNAADKFKK